MGVQSMGGRCRWVVYGGNFSGSNQSEHRRKRMLEMYQGRNANRELGEAAECAERDAETGRSKTWSRRAKVELVA